MNDSPRDSVQRVLELHLPDYRELRVEFPLWTYNRDPSRGASWHRVGFWPERARWSAVPTVASISNEISRLVDRDVWQILGVAFPTHLHLKKDEGEKPEEGGTLTEPDASARIPLRLELRLRAAYLATAFELSPTTDRLDDLTVPDDPLRNYGFDSLDIEEIVAQLLDTIFRGTKVGKLESGDLVGLRMGPSEVEGLYEGEYFARFMRLAADSYAGDDVESRRRTLATEFLTEAGLIADRDGGSKTSLPKDFLNHLRREARNLVEAVREYTPSSEKAHALADLVEDDRDLRGVDPSLRGYTEARVERLRRIDRIQQRAESPERDLDLPNLPWLVQFPFLRHEEIRLCRDLGGIASAEGLTSALNVADRLLETRLLPTTWGKDAIYRLAGSVE